MNSTVPYVHRDFSTHTLENVSVPYENINLFTQDKVLQESVRAFGADHVCDQLTEFGGIVGQADYLALGDQANRFRPEFAPHDRYGRRIDLVSFHPAYHHLMQTAMTYGLHSLPWETKTKGAHVHRAALCHLHTQVEAGHGCPVTMTFAGVAALRHTPSLASTWIPKVLSRSYDPRNVHWSDKSGLTLGMAMTEKQGGSDVRSNSTRAFPTASPGSGQPYELVGHKFFVSAPMCDAFLMLAQAPGGLSCFLVPRWWDVDHKNPMELVRLKDKMGNVSNASSEVELRGALGWMVGEEGRGVATILEMVALTRFDCMVGSTAGMHMAVQQAIHHAAHRRAFGALLIDQPMMQNVLIDLALEREAALWLSMRMANALDQSGSESERLLARIAVAIGKYWICKRTPQHAYEAMECIGGSGVMENSMMPRLYREAPINAIWEGSGNVQCLDVLRALHKSPQTLDVLHQEIAKAKGSHPELDALLKTGFSQFKNLAVEDAAFEGRRWVDRMAVALQCSLMFQYAPEQAAQTFCDSRLNMDVAHQYGSLKRETPIAFLLKRYRVDGIS